MSDPDTLLCIGAVLFLLIVLLAAVTIHLYLTPREKQPEQQELARNRAGGMADEYGDWARCPYNNPRR